MIVLLMDRGEEAGPQKHSAVVRLTDSRARGARVRLHRFGRKRVVPGDVGSHSCSARNIPSQYSRECVRSPQANEMQAHLAQELPAAYVDE